MFKIESYIAPLLMGYVDKYVKLRQEDFQLSLWGGDVVLNNLDLRLEALQNVLHLPVMFKSGHIHELRIHVPWTKLGSEPVVITINTIECILKVRDTGYGDASSTKSGDSQRKANQQARARIKAKRPDPGDDLPPGYLQSLMNRIVNNVNIIMNNLILKFVEDDIVLSLNVKSAECYSADMTWDRGFVDLNPSDLILRKVIEFCDLTVCLDKTNTSGRIESYQEPIIYRSSVSCRLHMTYDSMMAKMPSVTKFNVFCEKLDLSISDTQLPMFLRLLELCIALYYGSIDFDSEEDGSQESEPGQQDVSRAGEGDSDEKPDSDASPTDDEGWVSWAWSFVPQILPEEEELMGDKPREKPSAPILSIGFYIHHASVTFKLSEKLKEAAAQFGSGRVQFHPFLFLEAEGLSAEILMKGIHFFDAQCGVTALKLTSQGMCICGVKDADDPRSQVMAQAGEPLENKTVISYISHSLFDTSSPENQATAAEFVTDGEKHIERYTEQFGLQKYGAFWFDYLYYMVAPEPSHSGSKSSVTEDDAVFFPENSIMKIMIGPCHVNVTSTLYHRINKVLHCAWDHQYQPYTSSKTVVAGEEERRPEATEEEVQQMEEFIPTRTTHLMLIQPTITFLAAEHPHCDVGRRSYRPAHKKGKEKSSSESGKRVVLPGARVTASRFDLQVITPMYPKRLVRLISNIAGPSSNLLYHCHSHTHIKVFTLHAGLLKVEPSARCSHLLTLIPPCSASVYSKYLLLPKYWTNAYLPRVEWQYEVPQLSVNLTKASLQLMVKAVSTWQQKNPRPQQFSDDSLLGDLFPDTETDKSSSLAVLEVAVSGCELKCCSTSIVDAYTGSVTSIQCCLYTKDFVSGSNRVSPVIMGPSDTNNLHYPGVFKQPLQRTEVLGDCFNFTVQLPKNRTVSEAPAVILVKVEGFVACVEPALIEWLMYAPRPHPTYTPAKKDSTVTVDLALAQAASPLQTGMSQVSVHSSSSVTNPTGSRPLTQSHTHTVSHAQSPRDREYAEGEPKVTELADKIAKLFPLVKMLHIQADIRSSCIFFPDLSMATKEPSMDIPVNFHSSFQDGCIPNTLVVCLPSVVVLSSGVKPMSVAQEIPINVLDGSLIGDKLPWSVKLENFTAYSLHKEKTTLSLFKPLNVASTVAVSCKYTPPTSDNITALGLCLHIDMQPPTIAISQLQTQLCQTVVQKMLRLIKKGTSLVVELMKQLKPENDVPTLPPISSSPEKRLETTMSCDNDVVVTDQSEELSQENNQIKNAVTDTVETGNGVKLSLWTQLLIPRLELHLFGKEKTNLKETCLTVLAEDLATSLDIQHVYSKVKVTLGSFNVSHQQKCADETWKKGACEGILLSCRGELPRDTLLVTNKLWASDSHSAVPLFPSSETRQREQTTGFLNFTFTQALCKNVAKRMKKMNMDLPELSDTEGSSSEELYFHKYISEVCLKTEPCDIILYFPIFQSLLDIFDFGSESAIPKPAQPNFMYANQKKPVNETPWFSSTTIPLIYANIDSVRVILPHPSKAEVSAASDNAHEGNEDNSGNGNDTNKKAKSKLKTTLDHDMIVAQLHSITVQPRADNPLPREPIETELYGRAYHSGLSQQPGSAVEDRQYQAHFKDFSLSTGCWGELVRESKRAGRNKSPVSGGVQIPALEWNTFLTLQQQEREEVRLIPMASVFDLCLVTAPAIVYTRTGTFSTADKHLLVCGYAAEMNVTSDLDLYLSTSQVHLVSDLAQHWMSSLSVNTNQKPTASSTSQAMSSARTFEYGIDSGVESDMSTYTFDIHKQVKPNSASKVMTSADLGTRSKVMPFNILLTAGRISFTMYSHVALKENFTQAMPKQEKKPKKKGHSKSTTSLKGDNLAAIIQSDGDDSYPNQYDMCSDFDFMNVKADEEEKQIAAGTVCVRPFMYVYIAQPHSIMSCQTTSQKFEMSCYDIIVKAPQDQTVIPVEEHRLLPDRADFSSYWVETKAGCPNPKTGIPPSLYTLQISDFLTEPAHVVLKMERPVKLHVSLSKLDQVLEYVEELMPPLSADAKPDKGDLQTDTKYDKGDLQTASKPDKAKLQTEPNREDCHDKPGSSILSKLDYLEVVTGQIVVQLETSPGDRSPGLQLSSSSARLATKIRSKPDGTPYVMNSEIFVKDIFAKSVLGKKHHTLLGPTSVDVDLTLVWCEHSGPASLPRLICAIEAGVLPLYLGQEHVVCLQLLADSLSQFIKNKYPSKQQSSGSNERQGEDATVTSTMTASDSDDLVHDHTKDDLRTVGFEYIVDTDGSGLQARPGEIVFCNSNSTVDGNSTMIWQYHQPRVLSHASVHPVPFGLSSQEKPDRIPCTLQYWDEASGMFLGYIDFTLNEAETENLPLPEVKVTNSQDLVVARTWRIVICNTRDSENSEITSDLPEPLVLPASLAACMCIDSCFIPGLIAVMQGSLSMASIQLHLLNHLNYIGSGVPTRLAPYQMMSDLPEEQEFAVLTFDDLSASFSHIMRRLSRSEMQVLSTVSLDVLEYESLTIDSVIEPTSLDAYMLTLHMEKPPVTECNVKTGVGSVRVGRGAVHTLTSSLQAWTRLLNDAPLNEDTPHLVFSHIVICNDTQQTVRFGQVGTDENLALASREMHCYSWRSHRSKQNLHLCMDQPSWKWCEPFDISSDSTIVRTVSAKDQNYTVIVKVKQITNTHKQITISGHLVVSSRLSQHLEVNLMSKGADNSVKGLTSALRAGQTAPSFVIEQEEIQGVKFRLLGGKTVWSHEIHVNGDRMRENGLIKIPLPDKSSYIHVWCRIFCQHFKDSVQTLLLLTPLFILRSHLPRPLYVDMDTPRLKALHQLDVPGQAHEYQLHCVGGDITHNLAFRLAPTLPKSSPPLMLSTGLIEQVEHKMADKVDIDKLCYERQDSPALTWPYCFTEADSQESYGHAPHSSTSCIAETDGSVDQPSVDLNIRLSEYMPGCSTLLVDITPWCLVTNLSGISLVLVTASGKHHIPHGKTYAPPMFSGNEFRLGLDHQNKVLTTASIPVSEEEVANKRYSPDLGKVLFVDGYVHTNICIPGASSKAIFLVLNSQMEQDMRIVTIRERFAISNLTSTLFEVRLLAVPLGHSKVSGSNISYAQSPELIQCHKQVEKTSENVQSLLTWSLLAMDKDIDESSYVHYVSIREKTESEVETSKWSLPLRLLANQEGARLSVSVPTRNGSELSTRPYCMTAQIHEAVTYLVLSRDQGPMCKITNLCSFPIVYGQALMNITLSGTVVQEEAELIDDLPTLDPGDSAHYTMPHINSQYPAADAISYPRMHFCASLVQEDGSRTRSQWSTGVDVMSNSSTFVKLPNVADVKVQSKKVAMVTQILIEPISKAEISAKEIRSRLKGAETKTEIIEVAQEKTQTVETTCIDFTKAKTKAVKLKDLSHVFSAGLFMEQISLTLLDETTSREEVGEVMKLTCDDVYLSSFPVSSHEDSGDIKSCISLSMSRLQIDNQQYGQGQFDFPVLLVEQSEKKQTVADLDKMTVTEKHAVLRLSSFLHVQLVLTHDDSGTSVTESVELSLCPLSLYIDDSFIYRLLREVEGFIPNTLHCDKLQPTKVKRLPKSVQCTALALSEPIRIQYLCIQPVSMLLSVHASLKLFLASDHTPLSFGKFEKKDLYTSSQQMLRALVMHYASGAIFRAGIVVGSLEILGNPTGLVRSIGTGVADMVRMPYAGLTRGPGAFIGGVSRGMSSLLKNVSAGMITSVTNFAGSVSRNMDRLSLDSGHLQRQEENRRNRPIGVSDGLKQGLTGFGLSLLGAVAGLADQPIQSLISQSNTERRASTSSTASGLVAGMGKGLVGIVTKPIGGAAEFVSQAGQGILHGTGLGQLPERRNKPQILSRCMARNGLLKHTQKIFSSLPSTDILLATDALHLDLTGLEVETTLLLTAEIVFVVSCEEDSQQQAFAVRELEISECATDDTLLTIIWNDNICRTAVESDTSNKDRVAAFIDSAPTLAQPNSEDVSASDSQSESLSPNGSHILVPQYQFRIAPIFRELFLTMFNQAKNNQQGHGFPI